MAEGMNLYDAGFPEMGLRISVLDLLMVRFVAGDASSQQDVEMGWRHNLKAITPRVDFR